MALAQVIERGGRRVAIVNADSAQVYRDLRILSARPTVEEMGAIEHRLYGTWDGEVACSAVAWAAAAKAEIARIHGEGAVPILCGGTGLYIRTLLDGVAPVPAIDSAIREEVRAMPQADARAALEREDPAAATRLAPTDSARTQRALEVVRSTGRTLAAWQREKTGGIAEQVALHPLIMFPDREQLYERCDRRFVTMVEAGAVAEVATLLKRDFDPQLPIMRAIGVRELAGYLRGDIPLSTAVEAAQTATRQYAKRQLTWFTRQPPSNWPKLSEITDIPISFRSLFRFYGLDETLMVATRPCAG